MYEEKEIAKTLLEYLSSPVNSTEEKVDLILELLNRTNYQCDNLRKYSLAALRNAMKDLEIKESDNKNDNRYSSYNMLAIFGENNTFLIAKESSYSINVKGNIHKYTLSDALSNSRISECDFYKGYSSLSNIPWRNESVLINGVQSYIVPITNIIPAKYISQNGINFNVLQTISDTVNEYLANNPLFIKEVFVKQRKKESN